MTPIPRLTAEQRDNLVAYLDGELDEQATRQIEDVLARSPVARHEVEILTRTWEMLDALPEARAPADFTERTLATLRVDDLRVPLPQRAWFRTARLAAICVGWAAGLVVLAALGFLLTNRWIPDDSQRLVRELPLIEKLDAYREVEDVEFLRQLHRGRLLHDEPDLD